MTRAVRIVTIATGLVLLLATAASARLIIISIGKIEANRHIAGFVSGLTPEERAVHKVLVYIHTDQWHIHRGTRGRAGRSYATIGDDGNWKLRTVRGKTAADKVGAIVVPMEYAPPATIERLADVPHLSITIRNINHTPDDGKL